MAALYLFERFGAKRTGLQWGRCLLLTVGQSPGRASLGKINKRGSSKGRGDRKP